MVVLNSNDFVVLSSIRDKKNNLGLCKARGTTVKTLVETSKLSESTVRRSIKKLLQREYIDYGIKQINKDSFYVTEKGIKELEDVLKVVKISKEEK